MTAYSVTLPSTLSRGGRCFSCARDRERVRSLGVGAARVRLPPARVPTQSLEIEAQRLLRLCSQRPTEIFSLSNISFLLGHLLGQCAASDVSPLLLHNQRFGLAIAKGNYLRKGATLRNSDPASAPRCPNANHQRSMEAYHEFDR